jgi:hypothetical protein
MLSSPPILTSGSTASDVTNYIRESQFAGLGGAFQGFSGKQLFRLKLKEINTIFSGSDSASIQMRASAIALLSEISGDPGPSCFLSSSPSPHPHPSLHSLFLCAFLASLVPFHSRFAPLLHATNDATVATKPEAART